MADLDIYYKNDKIFSTDAPVIENLKTAGKYCEEDIVVDYSRPPLPSLSNPTTPSHVFDGEEYIDGQGDKQTGTYVQPTLPTLTDPASASDILDGKEAIDGNGDKITGTLVPPVDTGANGLYKSMIEGNVTELVDNGLTSLRIYAQRENRVLSRVSLPNATTIGDGAFYDCTSLTNVSFPNVTTIGAYAFYGCTSLTNVSFPNVTTIGTKAFVRTALTGIIEMPKTDGGLNTVYINRTCVLKVKGIMFGQNEGRPVHVWYPDEVDSYLRGTYTYWGTLKTVQFDNCNKFMGISEGGNALVAFIIRKPTLVPREINQIPSRPAGFAYYVPEDLFSQYASATNWVVFYNAGQLKAINEDTTATAGIAFTPTTTAQGIVSWDQVDLQSYSVGTVDSSTGTITPTHDGRLLIRGLDSNGDIVHVTYIQIGTGFDEEENLK